MIHFKAFGAQGSALTQIGRIKEGLLLAGATEALDQPADLVYSNDSQTHHEAISYRATHAPNAKLILNVLDIPEHLMDGGAYGGTHLNDLAMGLREADAITAISPFTRSQIHRYLGLAAYVIWNPVKDVNPTNRIAGERPYPYRVLISGRTNDPNKRIRNLAIPALINAGFQESEVAVCGGEWPGWGTNLGVVSDETLNDLLNSVDIVMSTTACSGLELAPIEAMICGAVPVMCYDLSTYGDVGVYPHHWGCYPSVAALAYRLRVLMDHPEVLKADREYSLSISEGLINRFAKDVIARNILNVYKQLTPFSS